MATFSSKNTQLDVTNGTAHVTTSGTPATMDVRFIQFDAQGDMPVDITDAGNVAGGRVGLDTYPAGVRRVDLIFHNQIGSGDVLATAPTQFPAAIGVRVAINADDTADANARLISVDHTGGGTVSAADDDRVIQLSAANAKETLILSEDLDRIDIIGIPNPATTATGPCFLEVRAYY